MKRGGEHWNLCFPGAQEKSKKEMIAFFFYYPCLLSFSEGVTLESYCYGFSSTSVSESMHFKAEKSLGIV